MILLMTDIKMLAFNIQWKQNNMNYKNTAEFICKTIEEGKPQLSKSNIQNSLNACLIEEKNTSLNPLIKHIKEAKISYLSIESKKKLMNFIHGVNNLHFEEKNIISDIYTIITNNETFIKVDNNKIQISFIFNYKKQTIIIKKHKKCVIIEIQNEDNGFIKILENINLDIFNFFLSDILDKPL